MKLLFIYINPTGRTTVPANISMLIGHIKAKRDYKIELFDTTFYKFEVGEPNVKEAWTMGFFLPIDKEIKISQKDSKFLLDDLTEKIKTFKPDLIATSCYFNHFSIAKNFLMDLKKKFPEIPNIVGGCHASFAPETVISELCVDMICVGEGEEALLELCDRIEKCEDITNIKNVWLKRRNTIIRNPVRKPNNLDELGDTDWKIFDDIHMYQPFHGKYFRVGMIEFGRGCPHRCTYCANAKYLDIYKEHMDSYFRHRDPIRFIKKLKKLKEEYKLELIYFQDGTFLTMSDDVLEKLAKLYEEEINLPCIIITTVSSITEKRLKWLKKMKCVFINMGIEEGNPEFRKKILKRPYMTNQQIIDTFKLVKKYGINTASYNVIGLPYETREDVFKTIELNRQCSPDSIHIQIFYPIEGCELKDVCLKNGFFNPKNETLHSQIIGLIKANVSLLENLPMSREEIHGLLKTFYLYVKMPKELYPFIHSLEKDSKFSREAILQLTKCYWRNVPNFKNVKDLVINQEKRDAK